MLTENDKYGWMASITFRLNQDAPVYDYKYYNKKKIKLQFGPRKAGIIFREGARETYDTHVSKSDFQQSQGASQISLLF